MLEDNFIPTVQGVLQGYRNGDFTPRELVELLQSRAKQYIDRNIWIELAGPELLEQCFARLDSVAVDSLPLYGVPFAAKDNIDIVGFATTAGCPEYSFSPDKSAHLTAKLIEAGAIPMGKTNLDQFATGLVGTRSPHGACGNAFNPSYISGGSSSGSAVAVALGLASFSLGTDTAGSGRVPAMLNNLIGLKPSRGLLSMTGVVPACRSLDCPSIFAFNSNDAALVFNVAASADTLDAYSRANPFSNSLRNYGATPIPPVIGVPRQGQLKFFNDNHAEALYLKSIERWKSLGAQIIEIDFEPLLDAARLLYEGPWVAERYAALQELIESTPEVIHPVVRGIVEGARGKTAVDTFKAEYQMQEYRTYAKELFNQVDFMLTPTAPRHYLIEELLEDPVQLNSNMGYYTNFMNLLDLCGVAVPAGFLPDGLPFGFSLIAPAFDDIKLLTYAKQWQDSNSLPCGAMNMFGQKIEPPEPTAVSSASIDIVVCGAHLSDFPLNWQLTERGGSLRSSTNTAKKYKLFALAGGPPERPGMVRDENEGDAIAVEVWSIPSAELGGFLQNIPYPLALGKVELADNSWVYGFVCADAAISDAKDITSFKSWRAYQDS